MAAYSPDVVKHNVRPAADHCCLITPADVKNLAVAPKQGDIFTYVEAALQTAVDKSIPTLAAVASQIQATDDVNALFIQTAHLFWGKKLSPVFTVQDITTGKPTESKLTALVHTWAGWVDSKCPIANFATSVGVVALATSTSDANTTFDLPSLPEGPFKMGEQLVVKNRFTATIPLKKDPQTSSATFTWARNHS